MAAQEAKPLSGAAEAPLAPPGSARRQAPAGPARPARPGRRRWRRLLFVLVPLVLVGAFLYYWFLVRPFETTDDAFIDGDVVPVAPQVSGQVVRLLVDDNQRVKSGELLLEIDPRDYEAGLAQARAALTAAKSRLDEAKAQATSETARVAQDESSLVAAQAEAARAQADLQRYQSVQSPAVSRSQLDLAQAQARSNQAAVDVARSKVKADQAQVALSQAGIQTADAEVQRNQAAVHQAELELSYTRVSAPCGGFVTHRTVQAGSYVQVGQVLLAVVPNQVWVVANFKETQLSHMRPGQPAEVSVDAYPHHTFKAHVDSIQRGSGARFSLLPPENASGNYVKVVQRVPVKIVFDGRLDPKLPLGPGMSVEPKVRVLPE